MEAGVSSIPNHLGEHYIPLLGRLHATLSPKTYLEIGAQQGFSLAMSKCASIAVDPDFRFLTNVFADKPVCHLFQMSSDTFFKEHDPTAIFGRPIDLAFLDGMHLYEFLLRDFINTEKHCVNNSIICLHDCIPLDAYMARRDFHDQIGSEESVEPGWWAGDVWKAVRILKTYRTDLKILALDAAPTGLITITNLDKNSTYLSDHYFDIIEEAKQWRLTDGGLISFVQSLAIQPASCIGTAELMAEHFWL